MIASRRWRDRNGLIVRARELRRAPTPPEWRLWQVLRQRPDGWKFRRQHPLGNYILDFYCPAARLVVEVDGDARAVGNNPRHDARRDAWLRDQGLRVVRYDAGDVMSNLEPVVISILGACRQ